MKKNPVTEVVNKVATGVVAVMDQRKQANSKPRRPRETYVPLKQERPAR